MILILFFITILLYFIAYYIFNHIKGYSEDDYIEIPGRYSWNNREELKEGAVPKRAKLKLWIVISAIIALLIPILNVIIGIVLIVCSFLPLDNSGYKYYPGKITGAIYNFFSNLFSKEL